jgi:hypothetical protein
MQEDAGAREARGPEVRPGESARDRLQAVVAWQERLEARLRWQTARAARLQQRAV